MTAPMVIVAGEALVDLVPRGDALWPSAAGSPVNVAVGLGRLGVATAFCGTVSTDGFGDLIATRLDDAGVALDLLTPVGLPTTLAVVHLDAEGRASYGFYLDGTSADGLTPDSLPSLPENAALHVSFGAIGPTTVPAGEALVHLIEREAGHRVVSLDPNVRPSAIDDLTATVARLEAAVAASDVVKASDEDLAALHPGVAPEEVAARWAGSGPALVVVTLGPDGAVAFGAAGRTEIPGRQVEVVDTVGAGDAFTAGLLGHLAGAGLLDREALRAIDADATTAALEHAVRVAAITCTRTGADPPTAADVG
ncbi:carbohydrate kinase family protein [Nitriliruptor alkaliphilus]|uniref:carbohydrate kinase family protein n=1 Tax=Nitriliruptor alkaliphilus TaxID=427918 RepID=UPI000696772E|nr:carbohydrate kinase [Nitriliruptor alkaliphilus]